MSNVSAAYLPAGNTTVSIKNTKEIQIVANGQFDALLSGAESKASTQEYADKLLESITLSMNQNLRTLAAQDSSKNVYPFSEEFEATFGTSGPLLDYINMITVRLNLSAEKNQALQDICIRNKDITYTPANVQKIAAELKEAGIG